jgi:hypothetical protein
MFCPGQAVFVSDLCPVMGACVRPCSAYVRRAGQSPFPLLLRAGRLLACFFDGAQPLVTRATTDNRLRAYDPFAGPITVFTGLILPA